MSRFARLVAVSATAVAFVVPTAIAGATTPNSATWTRVASPPAVRPLRTGLDAVACSTTSSCIAVGSMQALSSTPLVEKWDGAHWVAQATPALGNGTYGSLSAVVCASASTCFAVGLRSAPGWGHGTPLVEQWDGAHWVLVSVPVPGGANVASLSSVSCGSATSCTAVGEYDTATDFGRLIEHWDGSSWSLQSSPSPSPVHQSWFHSVSCGSPTTCTAVGTTFGAGSKMGEVVEQWNGTQWSITSAFAHSGWGLDSVSCFDSWHCLAVGGGNNLAMRGEGSAWTDVSPPVSKPNPELHSVACRAPVDCEVDVNYPAGALHWNGSSGSSWQAESFPTADQNAFMGGITCLPGSSCVAVGATSNPLAEVRHGTSWSSQAMTDPIGPTSGFVHGVSCDSTTHCVGVGMSNGVTFEAPYIEDWNGSTWSLDSRPLRVPRFTELESVSCASSASCVAVGEQFALNDEYKIGVALVLQNGRWNPFKVDGTWRLTGISCTRASHCIAAAYGPAGGVAVQWNGTSWSAPRTVIPNPGRTSASLASIACTDDTDCTAVGNSGSAPAVARLYAGTWHMQAFTSAALYSNFTGVACSTAARCVAVGYSPTIDGHADLPLAAQSNGNTWQFATLPLPQADTTGMLTGVSCIGATSQCWATGWFGAQVPESSPSQQSALEHWDGSHWSFVSGPQPPAGDTANELDGVSCVAGGQCMAVGEDAPSVPIYTNGSPLAVVYR
jgi:hypothetical protein